MYPSEEFLKQIEETKITEGFSYHDFMESIRENWEFSEWGWKQDGDIYYISTGGWSGNEDIIGAMMSNTMFWLMYWQQSRRGGHYIFAPMNMETIEKLSESS